MKKRAIINMIERVSATLLVVLIGISTIPRITADTDVLADTAKNHNNTCLGTSRIVSPVEPSSKDSSWQGSYVYFGSYNNNPIKFRVLAPSTTVYGGRTMFLDSDSVLFNRRYDDFNNDWATSELRAYLNSDFYTDSFDLEERNSIATSIGDGGLTYDTGSYAELHYGAPVSVSDRVFLLDASEVLNPAYGYSSNCGWIAITSSYGVSYMRQSANNHIKSENAWWLRSGYSDGIYTSGHGGTVEGALSGQYVHHESIGVSPAVNIDLDRVLFSTAISGRIGEIGAEYYLTVLSDNLSVVPGNVSISGSTLSCSATGNGDRVSILITDGAWNTSGSSIKYYDAFTGSFDLSSIGLSTRDWGINYHVYLIAEDINGACETDYSSDPIEISASGSIIPSTDGSVSMYRLYNPNSGEHFYTSDAGERSFLVSIGWNDEGIGWYAPASSSTPVYRLYNQNGGEHHYTTSLSERNYLISIGWNDEGIGWYSETVQSQRICE